MKTGTKSILFGAHAFWLHPWFVAWAWAKLYGFPRDLRLWVAFFVHDLGYWGMDKMDDEVGESHPQWGANFMHRWFDGETDPNCPVCWGHITFPGGDSMGPYHGKCGTCYDRKWHWFDFVLLHSRFYAKKFDKPVSRLCYADKLSLVLTPWWLYLPMVRASGEIHEYMKLSEARTAAGEPKYASMNVHSDDQMQWYLNVQEYLRRWVAEHCDGRPDTWTPNVKTSS